jgi:F0F1-type ATP synthase membrane subunit b/b'
MPQFDIITWLSQEFWLTLVFFTFYLVVLRYYLPGLARILKIRKKKLDRDQAQGSSFTEEGSSCHQTYEDQLVVSAHNSRDVMGKTQQSGQTWLQETVSRINNLELDNTQRGYINLTGQLTGKKELIDFMAKNEK